MPMALRKSGLQRLDEPAAIAVFYSSLVCFAAQAGGKIAAILIPT
ncbi:hypothetical protein MAXJ12_34644 [Mesorhizobium alhagi CCNWXJ12-2]|uniref:Uncharacterized protein n=1 Tax=Mesorhizobium alhagi CCNWXJ12-2 TaxID=1107882 RepID=H0I367_9HYPH|nr:hypothetical protein MAXJ12_34644 [Mesorhizobium alhagi CCNWXJ12-2]